MIRTLLAAATAAALMTGGAAATPTVSGYATVNAPVQGAPRLMSLDLFSSLAGMDVSYTLGNGGSGSTTWMADLGAGAGCGRAEDEIIRVRGCGDTFSNVWTMNSLFTQITSVTFDMRGIAHWFDRTAPSFGTPDSLNGRDFEIDAAGTSATLNGRIAVEYRGIHGALIGDAWKIMELDFTQLAGGGLDPGFDLVYYQDTDPVPLPATLPMGLGAAGLLAWVARRRRAA